MGRRIELQRRSNYANVVEDHPELLGKSKQTNIFYGDHSKKYQVWLEQAQITLKNKVEVQQIKGVPIPTL
jgi:hypothetical protein